MASSVGDEICPSRLVAQTVLFVACEKRIPRDGGALRHLPRGDAGERKDTRCTFTVGSFGWIAVPNHGESPRVPR